MTSTKKFEGIEALRGLAVLMTVFAHLPLMTAPFIGTGIVSFWHMGVPIFFGISGWIIAHAGMIWLACYFLLIVAVVILVNVAASLHSTPKSIILSILIFLGARSYSLYVLHFQFISWGGVIGQMNGINFSDPLLYDAILVASIVFCLPVLELIHQCVEQPCVRLAHHLAEKMHARA